MTNQEVYEKVQKLLALSESPNEAEAANALSKAHLLLEKHNLSMKDVVYTEKKEFPQPFIASNTILPSWMELLINNVTELNYCTTIKVNHKDGTIYTVIGRPINVTVSFQLIEYLSAVINRIATLKEEKEEAFKFGMVYSILKRLYEKYNPSEESKSLTLYTQKENDNLINRLFGNGTKNNEIKPDTKDSGAYFRGWVEGKSVGLEEQISQDKQEDKFLIE